jgi:TonB family protein
MNKGLLIGGAAAVVLLAGFAIYSFSGSQKNAEAQKLLVQLQQQKALLDQQKADLDAQANAASQKQQQIQAQLQTTTSASEKAALQKQLEEQQKKQEELDARRQKVAAAAQQAEQKTAQIARTAKVEPPPAPKEEPKPAPPQPVQQAPTPAAPTPAQQTAPQQAGAAVTESPAIVSSRATPVLPTRARMANAWGPYHEMSVKLRVFVDETGRPLKATILQGSALNLGFDDAAVNAAMQSQYSPATRNGQPVRGTVEMSYIFKR